jgi:hypothetical protein
MTCEYCLVVKDGISAFEPIRFLELQICAKPLNCSKLLVLHKLINQQRYPILNYILFSINHIYHQIHIYVCMGECFIIIKMLLNMLRTYFSGRNAKEPAICNFQARIIPLFCLQAI